jgi:hypothetical protein
MSPEYFSDTVFCNDVPVLFDDQHIHLQGLCVQQMLPLKAQVFSISPQA